MNAFNRIAALIAKEFRHLGRDRRTLAVVLAANCGYSGRTNMRCAPPAFNWSSFSAIAGEP